MIRRLCILLVAALPLHALATICPASNSYQQGIGDGCSTTYEGIDLGWLFPHIGLFRSTFTPACDGHDKCYTMLGTDYGYCDFLFLTNMRAACRDRFNQYFQPVEYAACHSTAYEYYAAVSAYRSYYPEHMVGFQNDALYRSRVMQYNVETDSCGTTPERTTLYAPSLIATINNTFVAYAGRPPTIYEFLDAVNAGDLVNDPSGWSNLLSIKAANAASVQPPSTNYTITGGYTVYRVTLSMDPAEYGVDYVWRVPQLGYGPSLSTKYGRPQYDRYINYSGFVKATNAQGVRNMALVETTVFLQGICAPGPGVSCY